MTWPSGETAFVTGAASGIGLGISRALVAAGARVALVDIDGDRLAAVAEELTAAGGIVVPIVLDISDASQWLDAADRAESALGPVSILCGNAGVSGSAPIDDLTFTVWKWVQSINIDAQYLGVETFLPRFRARGGRAHIMSTASMAGIVPMVNVAAYASSKFASVGFHMVLRDELKDTEIGVSLLTPGTVATRLAHTDEALQAQLVGRQADAAAVEHNNAQLSLGADPDRVGEQVVQAMRDRRFLIVTHREWAPLVRRVHDEIEQAFADFDGRHGADPTPAALLEGGYAAAG
ncbi:SDR family NAD(P)-dependent oxidoreductase [Microbacterium sp. No. 7]|uniref:SDR family NAD(P)-dependent oxidoreductase n=1 Tax=Microbacterium sp. No. 7 TaxID=1714373 RepID=UPI0006D0B63E|nr:SDR family NAD(P)-dependent oxidoreductase [Microbacterium sp. No. 7]ALJ20494.1 short-chain dehydrogenase [Microbacterium sp. No. 7]